MEEEFYSVLKLTSGEELISKVSPCDEGDRMILMLNQPIVIKNIFTSKLGVRAYSVEPWIKLVDDDIFFIDMNAVITMTEVSDFEIIKMYKRYVKDTYKGDGSSRIQPSKTMGFISTVEEFKSTLENLYKS